MTERRWDDGEVILDKIKEMSRSRRAAPRDFFCEFLGDIWVDNTPEDAMRAWKRQVEQFPWYADDALYCMDKVLEDPPADVVSLMQECGWITLDEEFASGDDERKAYVAWLTRMRDDFKAVYDAA